MLYTQMAKYDIFDKNDTVKAFLAMFLLSFAERRKCSWYSECLVSACISQLFTYLTAGWASPHLTTGVPC